MAFLCLTVNFIIQKLKSKHTSLKKYTSWAKLIYFSLILREREEKKNQIFRTLDRRQPNSCEPMTIYNNLLRWSLYQTDRSACCDLDQSGITGSQIPISDRYVIDAVGTSQIFSPTHNLERT